MKKTHIFGILILAAALGVLLMAAGEMSTYAAFKDATFGKKVQVVAYLAKDQPISYDPERDPNHFSFYAKDKDGKACKVSFNGAKPQDFERSEQIVLTGIMQGEDFAASNMLMKCPSKYEKEQIVVANNL